MAQHRGEEPALLARERLQEALQVHGSLLALAEEVASLAAVLVSAYRNGHKVLLFGNGGSAADAQHIAAELVGKFYIAGRPAIPALSLTTNSSSLTAIANDLSYADVFARQVEAFGQPGDVAVGISTSGASENVLQGLRRARELGLVTVALTGASGGRLKGEVDHSLCVPSQHTPRIQEAHILIGHILCEIVERELFLVKDA